MTMTVLAIVAIFDLVAFFFRTDLPHDLLVVILTTFNNGGFLVVVAWWFQSSHSSAGKDAVIEKLTTKP